MGKKLIIDVDTGTDDAQAIMIALTTPGVDILAITCVTGNTGIDTVCYNTLRVLKHWDRLDIPVYKGAYSSILGKLVQHDGKEAMDTTAWLGDDGLGNVPESDPPDLALLQKEHAVDAMIRLVHKYPGEITLVTLAPLTNVALALRLDPEFGKNLKEVVIMGGNIEGRGCCTTSADFNFYCDPEAAYACLKDLGADILICTYEVCRRCALPWDWVDKLMSTDTDRGRFHKAINQHSVDNKRKARNNAQSYYHSCDPTTMVVALSNAAIQESTMRYCTVELQGQLTRAQMVVDWQASLKKDPNVEIVTKIDTDVVMKYFDRMLQ